MTGHRWAPGAPDTGRDPTHGEGPPVAPAPADSVSGVRDQTDPTPTGASRPRMARRALLAGAVATGLAAVGLKDAVGSEAYAATRPPGSGRAARILRPGSLPYPDLPAGHRHPAPDRAHRGAHDGEPLASTTTWERSAGATG